MCAGVLSMVRTLGPNAAPDGVAPLVACARTLERLATESSVCCDRAVRKAACERTEQCQIIVLQIVQCKINSKIAGTITL